MKKFPPKAGAPIAHNLLPTYYLLLTTYYLLLPKHMYWTNFLHIYQPPAQKPYWIKRVAEESYKKLMNGFLNDKDAKVTLNINACLTELLIKNKGKDILEKLKTLAARGQVEFTASAKYHPFLPLLPEAEIVRQIKLNEQTNKKIFGKLYQPRGFFSPEMAYSKKIAKIASKLGYLWVLADELAYNGKVNVMDHNLLYKIKGIKNLHVFFRERDASFRILSAQIFSPKLLYAMLGARMHKTEYLLTAMDGETFGHHRPGLEDMLFNLYADKKLKSVTISELFELYNKVKMVEPLDSTWALMKKDLVRKTPFSRWHNPANPIHVKQWQLTYLAIKEFNKIGFKQKFYPKVRKMLDQAIHSDQYWWASAQPWWSIEMIEGGAKELMDTVLVIPSASKKAKEQAKKLYQEILYTSFAWQRSGKVDQLVKESDEDVTQRIVKQQTFIPKKELERMIHQLKKQMQTAAKALEYERAAQIRNRIRELEEKL